MQVLLVFRHSLSHLSFNSPTNYCFHFNYLNCKKKVTLVWNLCIKIILISLFLLLFFWPCENICRKQISTTISCTPYSMRIWSVKEWKCQNCQTVASISVLLWSCPNGRKKSSFFSPWFPKWHLLDIESATQILKTTALFYFLPSSSSNFNPFRSQNFTQQMIQTKKVI